MRVLDDALTSELAGPVFPMYSANAVKVETHNIGMNGADSGPTLLEHLLIGVLRISVCWVVVPFLAGRMSVWCGYGWDCCGRY